MSELFTQNYSDKPLFHTDTDISESLHNQVDEASNGEELLDNTEKQGESLLSNDDYVSETESRIADLIAELEIVCKANQAIQEDKEKVEQIQSG